MLRKIGKVWHYQAKVNGKTVTRSTEKRSKREAEKVVPELMREVQLLREQPKNSPRLFEAIVREVARLEMEVSKGHIGCVFYSFQSFAKWIGKDVELSKVDAKMLDDYMRHLVKNGKARSTVEKAICYIRRMLRLRGFDVAKPKMISAPYTRNRRFSDDELLRFFNESTDRFRHLWLILLATGCRLSDMVPSAESTHQPVLKSEVDLGRGIINVRPSKLKPNEDPFVRPVSVPEEMLPVFKEQMDSTPKDYPFLFETIWKARRAFDLTLERAGLEKKTPQGKLGIHSFRSTYLTKMGEALNGNAWLLKEVAGHKSIRTTEIYCQPAAPVIPISMLHLMAKPKERVQEIEEMGVRGGCKALKKPAEEAG